MNNIKFIIVNADNWWRFYVLSQDVRLLQADCQPKIFATLGEAVHQCMSLLLGVASHCCVISKQHVPDQSLEFGYQNQTTYVV